MYNRYDEEEERDMWGFERIKRIKLLRKNAI